MEAQTQDELISLAEASGLNHVALRALLEGTHSLQAGMAAQAAYVR